MTISSASTRSPQRQLDVRGAIGGNVDAGLRGSTPVLARDDPVRPAEVSQHLFDLLACQHHRQPFRPLGTYDRAEVAEWVLQDILVEKQEGRKRLVLGRGGDVLFQRQMGKKGADVRLGQPTRVAAMMPDVAPHPAYVGFFGAEAQMFDPAGFLDTLENIHGRAGGLFFIAKVLD